jgi:hypothetical protein
VTVPTLGEPSAQDNICIGQFELASPLTKVSGKETRCLFLRDASAAVHKWLRTSSRSAQSLDRKAMDGLIRAIGPPARGYRLADGRRVIEYDDNHVRDGSQCAKSCRRVM